MGILTTAEIDGELSSRTEEVAAISATMVELDSHPGLQHLRSYPPTGATAGTGGNQAGGGALGDQFTFELSQGDYGHHR